jgi:DnaJ-class molecular chaperone
VEIVLLIALAFGGYKFLMWAVAQNREAELQRGGKSEDERYDRIVNCPTCEGTGECWLYHRVTSEGFVFDDPRRRADIERGMDENFKHIRPETYSHIDSYGTHESYKRGQCPHCEGSGTAFARFETIPESQASCKSCVGRGVVMQSVKADVGVAKVQVQCGDCRGSGRTIMSKIRQVHVKFLKPSSAGPVMTLDLASFEPPDFFDVSKPRFGNRER